MPVISYLILGTVISVLSGFFGIGGGFILTPTLLLIGFSPIEAITTSLFFTVATSISGIVAHFRMKNIYWKEGFILGISGIIATQIAHPVVIHLQKKGWDELVIPTLFILLLSFLIFELIVQGKVKKEQPALEIPLPKVVQRLIIIGFIAGFISTTLGVGGGFIIVPLVISFLGRDSIKAVGSSLFAVFLIVAVGFISYISTVSIDYHVGILLVVGGLIGSQYGASMTRFFQPSEIEWLLIKLYICTLISVLLKLFHLNIVGLFAMFLFLGYFLLKSASRKRWVKQQISKKEQKDYD